MPIFAHIEAESEVQLEDRTRLDASKSHYTKNQPAFTKLWIRPGADQVPYSVYDSNIAARYLDWEFSTWNIDIDSTNNKIDFTEGSNILEGTLTAGTYTLPALVAAIAAEMTAQTVTAYTYSASLDVDNKLTLSSTGGFELLIETGDNRLVSIINKLFFGSKDLTGSSTYTSGIIQFLSKKVSTIAGEDKAQVQKVTTVADVSGSLNNKYFIIYAQGDSVKYYVWFNVNSLGTDPSLAGYTGIEVAIATNATASVVATAIAAAIDASAAFSASAVGAVVTFTHATYNWNTPAVDSASATGFTFSVYTQGEAQDVESIYLNVYSEAGDFLWCTDQDLIQYEPDIRKWIVAGRNSFLNIHRQAQKSILEWLDRQGYETVYKLKYTKFDVIDISEVREWSRFMALRMIFEGIKNSQDDLYAQKRATYESRELDARKRMILRIDTDGTGDTFLDEGLDTASIRLAFR